MDGFEILFVLMYLAWLVVNIIGAFYLVKKAYTYLLSE